MQNALNPLVTVYQTQLEASRRFAEAIFAGTEKIDRVMIGATQRAFNEQLNFVEAMTTARDPRSVGSALQSGFMIRNPDDAVNYQKEIVRIIAEMQNEIGKGMRDYMDQLRTQTASSTDAATAGVQAQAGNATANPVTSMFSVWEAAFREVADLAKKNMTAARSAAEGTVSRAAQSAAGYADAATASAGEAATKVVDSAADTVAHTITPEEGTAEERKGSPSPGGKKK